MEPLLPFTHLATAFGAADRPPGWMIERLWLLGDTPLPRPTWRDAHGVPPNVACYRVTVRDPLGKEGYEVTVVGYAVGETVPQTAPTLHIVDGLQSVLLLAVYRCVPHAKSTLWLEALWTAESGVRIDVHGLEQQHSARDLSLIHQGLVILCTLEARGGRPPDMEEEAFRQMYWEAYQKVLASGQRPTKTEVAAELLIPTKTLKRNRDRYNLPWPPLSPH